MKHPKTFSSEAEADQAYKQLAAQGWCAVSMGALGGEVVVWAQDAQVANPERWRDFPVYTVAELAKLRDFSPASLRTIHETKRIFPGARLAEVTTKKEMFQQAADDLNMRYLRGAATWVEEHHLELARDFYETGDAAVRAVADPVATAESVQAVLTRWTLLHHQAMNLFQRRHRQCKNPPA